MNLTQFLGGLNPQSFIDDYWYKKPLLIRNAVPEIASILTKETLIEKALDEDVESRLILEKGGDYPWQVIQGPIDAYDLEMCGNSHWTVMVHGLNHHFLKLAELQQLVSFIPTWQFDDVMASFASDQGSVGAHTDHYNVFIIQGKGRRKWQLQLKPVQEFDENLEIKQLKHFKPDIEWVLEPGDMIYLPPEVAHYGISIGESISYSIGFRALDYQELVKGYIHHILHHYQSNKYYSEPQLTVQKSATELHKEALRAMASIIQTELLDERTINQWVSNYLSEPKGEPEENEDITLDEFLNLSDTHSLKKYEYLRYHILKNDGIYVLSILGESYRITKPILDETEHILNTHPFYIKERSLNNKAQETKTLFYQLYLKGAFYTHD